MAAAMNGMALHGGVIPYGGTFLCFTDYCRPSIRLAASWACASSIVMTHDSIGLGEDGPTHQPVEHLAALRVIPNLLSCVLAMRLRRRNAGRSRSQPKRPQRPRPHPAETEAGAPHLFGEESLVRLALMRSRLPPRNRKS